MELEIKCLECNRRTRRFEIGPAVFISEVNKEILLKNNIVCPKCKKDISNEKCITPKVAFIFSSMASTMLSMGESMLGGEKSNSDIPSYLEGIELVSKKNYDALKKQSKASIKLVNKLNNYSTNDAK